MLRCVFRLSLFVLVAGIPLCPGQIAKGAPDLLLADNHRSPGAIIEITRGGERDRFAVNPAALPKEAREAIPKVGSVAISPSNEVFFCSGLDGFVWKLERGRQVAVHQHGPTVRDLAFGAHRDMLFFTVVRTPQNDEQLADGEIFRKNIRTGEIGRVGVVRQEDVGGNWWGSIAIHRGQLYVSTMGRTSRILRQRSTGWEMLLGTSEVELQGIDFESNGDLYLVAGSGKVFRSTNLRDLETAAESHDARFSDIALEPEPAADVPGLGIEISDAFLRTGDYFHRRP